MVSTIEKLFVVFTSVCFFLSSGSALSQEISSNVDTDFIQAALNTYYGSGIKDIHCTFKYIDRYTDYGFEIRKRQFDEDPAHRLHEFPQVRQHTVSMWWMPDGKYRYEFAAMTKYKGIEQRHAQTIANNNITVTSLRIRKGQVPINATGIIFEANKRKGVSYPNAVRFGLGIGPVLFNKFLEENENKVLGVENVGSERCYVLQTKSHFGSVFKIWFNPEKDFRAPLIQCFTKDGELLAETKTTFKKVNNVWFPFHGECKYYEVGSDDRSLLTRIEEFHAIDAKVNEGIEPSTFKIQFPPGTLIKDTIMNISYRIPGDKVMEDIYEMIPDKMLEQRDQILGDNIKDRRNARMNIPQSEDSNSLSVSGSSTTIQTKESLPEDIPKGDSASYKPRFYSMFGAFAALFSVIICILYLIYGRRLQRESLS